MKTILRVVAFLTFAAGMAQAAEQQAARVDVTFVNPDNFTDIKDEYMDTGRSRDQLLDQLKKHLVSSAGKFIGADQRLEIKVTDVDLAGDFEPWRGMEFMNIRVVRDLYPPRVELEFRLLDAQGKVVSEGKRRLQDLSYLMMASLQTSDWLRYEKRLLDDWLRHEFKRVS